jgi:AGZA family xanthine/uracil permease-like MFS transporter
MRWFVRGDVDGFFGLALDNFVQLLLIASLWRFVLKMPEALLYQQVLPGVAVSLLVGNLFYAWQARRLARRTGRTDVCALPYGINTVTVIAYTFLVMLPAKERGLAAGMTEADAARFAWQAGLAACFWCGAIEFLGAFIARPVRRATPRAALLATLAAIALGFIALGFFFRTFAHPLVGLTTFGIVLLVYFGRVRFKGGIPGGLVAVALGTAIAWATGLVNTDDVPALSLGWLPPVAVADDLVASLRGDHLALYLSVIVPMSIFNLVGSLQNIESAEAAGDPYPTAPSLAVNGVGSMAAALFGSCFPTTIYIGHPGWKAMGARAGYSVLNCVFFLLVCLTGALGFLEKVIPIDAGMAIVLWIGIVITAQAFQAVPREHAPAVVVGLLPGVAAWGVLMIKTALQVGGVPLNEAIVPVFEQKFDTWVAGALALEQGFIFTSMVLAAATVALIERHFVRAAVWCFIAAGLSLTSIMHGYEWVGGNTVGTLSLAWSPQKAGFVFGYLIMGACFLLARWVTEPYEGEGH